MQSDYTNVDAASDRIAYLQRDGFDLAKLNKWTEYTLTPNTPPVEVMGWSEGMSRPRAWDGTGTFHLMLAVKKGEFTVSRAACTATRHTSGQVEKEPRYGHKCRTCEKIAARLAAREQIAGFKLTAATTKPATNSIAVSTVPVAIRIGNRLHLNDGSTPILRDCFQFSDGIVKAFVEHAEPKPWGVDGRTVIGHATRLWVDAPGFSVARDRDGVKIGMIYKPITGGKA